MLADPTRRFRQPPEFGIEERNVERRVVDDEFRAAQELHQLDGDLGEAGLPCKELGGQAVDQQRARIDFALGTQVAVEHPAGAAPVHDLDAADLDDAVALLGLETGVSVSRMIWRMGT